MTSGYIKYPLIDDLQRTLSASEGAEACQPPDDHDPDYRRERQGNNRYHQPKALAKVRRKIAKKSKQRNRRRP